MSAISFTPSFTLRGVNPRLVHDKYAKGEFSKPLSVDNKINVDKIPNGVGIVGNNSDCKIYSIRDRQNYIQLIHTTNHSEYVEAKKNNGQQIDSGRCLWCRFEIKSDGLGLPIRYESKRSADGRILHVFYCVDKFCCFEHALQSSIHRNPTDFRYTHPQYRDSATLLRLLFELVYPGKELKILPDSELMEENGGTLKFEEVSSKHVYTRLSNIILTPIKFQYARTLA